MSQVAQINITYYLSVLFMSNTQIHPIPTRNTDAELALLIHDILYIKPESFS